MDFIVRFIAKIANGLRSPTQYHVAFVIFLEYFSWGLLFNETLKIFTDEFKDSSFLANGLIQGIKGILSFFTAPFIGSLSDTRGRKVLLFFTVVATCCPIPFMAFNTRLFFILTAASGLLAVTFTIVFAYVADCTDEIQRIKANGLVSATFAASLVTSPAIGTIIRSYYDDANVLILFATTIAILDIIFIAFAVPESLPIDRRNDSWNTFASMSRLSFDPFISLRRAVRNKNLAILSAMIMFTNLPEAGQTTCIFLYLRNVVRFSPSEVAGYVAYVGLLSAISQTFIMTRLFNKIGQIQTFRLSIVFQIVQLLAYFLSPEHWAVWLAGLFVALSTMGYPSLSTLLSLKCSSTQQGFIQGMVTGYRSLCTGLGPAIFGSLFYLAGVNMVENRSVNGTSENHTPQPAPQGFVGLPFLFGAFCSTMCLILSYLFRFDNILEEDDSDSSIQSPQNHDVNITSNSNCQDEVVSSLNDSCEDIVEESLDSSTEKSLSEFNSHSRSHSQETPVSFDF